ADHIRNRRGRAAGGLGALQQPGGRIGDGRMNESGHGHEGREHEEGAGRSNHGSLLVVSMGGVSECRWRLLIRRTLVNRELGNPDQLRWFLKGGGTDGIWPQRGTKGTEMSSRSFWVRLWVGTCEGESTGG